MWKKLPPDRSAIPVLLYHGIGPESNFSNASDASYGVGTEDFAKQMTMIQHAGYETIDLQTFIDFVQNKPVDLPPRPLLLTFDDARADSWTGADGILRKLHFNAVMFVDVGRVDGGDPEYLTWHELATVQDSGRWQLQLHSGKGHTQIHYGPGPDDYGPFYAYEQQGEDFDGWRDRVHSDIAWGQTTLADHISAYAAARLRSPVRQLRPGRHQRPPDPRRPPRLAHAALRRRLHPGRQRPGASRSRTAAGPNPGHPRHHRRRPARDAALRRDLTARSLHGQWLSAWVARRARSGRAGGGRQSHTRDRAGRWCSARGSATSRGGLLGSARLASLRHGLGRVGPR